MVFECCLCHIHWQADFHASRAVVVLGHVKIHQCIFQYSNSGYIGSIGPLWSIWAGSGLAGSFLPNLELPMRLPGAMAYTLPLLLCQIRINTMNGKSRISKALSHHSQDQHSFCPLSYPLHNLLCYFSHPLGMRQASMTRKLKDINWVMGSNVVYVESWLCGWMQWQHHARHLFLISLVMHSAPLGPGLLSACLTCSLAADTPCCSTRDCFQPRWPWAPLESANIKLP